jgi:hypothetical protein
MSCDKLVYDLSQEIEGSPNVFIKKDWLNILDNQNGQYSSNQSVVDTSQLSNSNKYMSYREAYLSVPMLLTLTSSTPASNANFLPATAGGATSADYSIGLKNWFGTIVHSLTLDYNGTTIIQQTPYINMWNSFKLLTSLSWNDVAVMGSTIGFYPDNPLSWAYNAIACPDGIGVSNNTDFRPNTSVLNGVITAGDFNNYASGRGNNGFQMRQTFINFDPDGEPSATAQTYDGAILSTQSARNLWKSYISLKRDGVNAGVAGVLQISVVATIYLRHLHSFFNMCPLLKGVYMKATLNLNNTSTSFSAAGAAGNLTLTSVSNAVGGVNPLMIASAKAGNGNATLGATTYIANVSVGAVCLDSNITSLVGNGAIQGALSRNIYLYIPAYTFNPIFEQAYLSSPIKRINYTDVYQYQILNQATNTPFNQLLTNGIANIKSVLAIPFWSATGGATELPGNLPAYLSPFDTAGTGTTSPMCLLTNFNVVVSGQNMIYNTQRYSFEQFNNQLYGIHSVNGGLTEGINSSLIDFQAFEQCYCYYYVDVSRMLPVEETVPKSVQLVGQNQAVSPIDLICFIEYGVSISIDALTGARV